MNPYNRKLTKQIKIGNTAIGGENPILIQSMTNTDTRDIEATAAQINKLTDAGCELVRVAVLDENAAQAIKQIKKKMTKPVPVAADIHFDYKLAVLAVENGADKLRINPGNIGGADKVREVTNAAMHYGVPIRIGVNSGSVEKEILSKYGGVTAEGLVESAMRHVEILERLNFNDIIISIKTTDVPLNISTNLLLSQKTNYPLHIGVTEAGTLYTGTIKSSAGIAAVLTRGVGDTIRVSLSADPVEEIRCAKQLLKSLGIRQFGAEIIACPTCGRTKIDLIRLAEQVEKCCEDVDRPIKIAVMGCVVNGPGEARQADLGIAGGDRSGVIFRKGEVIATVSYDGLFDALMEEVKNIAGTKHSSN